MKSKWPGGLTYLDLYAGPGVCYRTDTRMRLPGSPVIAARAAHPFRRILLCDVAAANAEACKLRIEQLGATERTTVFQGDCNEVVGDIASRIPTNSLTLAFIDPTGLDIVFSTMESIARARKVDFLVLFADRMDLVRNVDLYYHQNGDSKIDRMLGHGVDWRKEYERLDNRTALNVAKLFLGLLQSQMRKRMGYEHFAIQPVSGTRGPLYCLLHAAKHPLAQSFWQRISGKERSGQDTLFPT